MCFFHYFHSALNSIKKKASIKRFPLKRLKRFYAQVFFHMQQFIIIGNHDGDPCSTTGGTHTNNMLLIRDAYWLIGFI